MQTRIVQVQPEPWPSGYGEAVAVLEASLTWLAQHHSLRLYEGTDNLDNYHAAVVRLPSGRRVGLLRHAGLPDSETEVHADAHDDPDAATRELLDALGMPLSTCTWLRQRVPTAAGSSAER